MDFLRINYEKLTEAPFSDQSKDLYVEDLNSQKDLDQISEELIRGVSSTYLISGYRGAGKTSFINALEGVVYRKSVVLNKKVIFVKINMSKNTHFIWLAVSFVDAAFLLL